MLSDSLQSDSDPNLVGIERNPTNFTSDPIRISSDSVQFRPNPDRNPTARNPTTTLSDPIGFLWKMSDSDEIRRGSDRFGLDLQVGLNLLGWFLVKIFFFFKNSNLNEFKAC